MLKLFGRKSPFAGLPAVLRIFLLVLLTGAPLVGALAETEDTAVLGGAGEIYGPFLPLPAEPKNTFQQIDEQWALIRKGIEERDLKVIHNGVTEIVSFRDDLGYRSLEEDSLELLAQARIAFAAGNQDDAAFYVRKALDLSPGSPRVWFGSVPMLRLVGEFNSMEVVYKIWEGLRARPSLILSSLLSLYYPLMWAVTLALYVCFLYVFAYQIDDLMRVIAKRFKPAKRGVGAPLVTVACLAIPCVLGPLWCLAVWSAIIFLFLPSRRALGLTSAVVIALWGFSLATRENVGQFLEDDRVSAAMRVAEKDYIRGDIKRVEELFAEKPSDSFIAFSAGLAARRQGDLARAREIFKALYLQDTGNGYVLAELGALDLIEGDAKSAGERFQKAAELGINNPALLYNRSRLAIEQLDLKASEKFFDEIVAQDEKQAKAFQALEADTELPKYLLLAEQSLPTSFILTSALEPVVGAFSHARKKAGVLMPGLGPIGVGVVGVIVFVFGLLMRERRLASRQSFYADYSPSDLLVSLLRFLPGGSWALAGKTTFAILVTSLSLLLLMPLLRWPKGSYWLVELAPELSDVYLICVGLIIVTFTYLGSGLREER